MKKILAVLALVFACLWGTAFAADFSHLIILHTNDTHGYDQRADGVNGMATVAALKEDYEAKGYKVLLVDAGDAIQDNNLVNFSKGKTAIDFMNAVGYDAMTLGNHEFDYGPDVTMERIKQAKFPIVSANIIVEATGKPFTGKTHAIIRKGDLKIGVFGLTTPSTITTSNPKSTRGLTFLSKEEMYAAAQKEVAALKAAHCDLIVAIGHLGSEPDAVGDRSNDVLANVKGIDVFIDGHDHTVKNLYIDGSLLTETGSHLANIGVVRYEDGKWQEDLHAYGQFNKEDAKVKAIVDKAQAAIDKRLATKVGMTPFELNGSRDPGVRTEETNLGDFLTDAYLWQVRQAAVLDRVTIDGALMNGGSIRASIEACELVCCTSCSHGGRPVARPAVPQLPAVRHHEGLDAARDPRGGDVHDADGARRLPAGCRNRLHGRHENAVCQGRALPAFRLLPSGSPRLARHDHERRRQAVRPGGDLQHRRPRLPDLRRRLLLLHAGPR